MTTYKVYHKLSGEYLGAASSLEMLGELIMDLYFDDGVYPHEVRVEEVEE